MSMLRVQRLLCFLAAAVLTGCGGGGGTSIVISAPQSKNTELAASPETSSVSPAAPAGNPSTVSTPETSSVVNEGTFAKNSQRIYSDQLALASLASGIGGEEVYDPQTRSSMVEAFVQTTLAASTASRAGNVYLIASSTFGIAKAARDLLAGIGIADTAYTFLNTASHGVNNRSAYLQTSANSIVNILSNPLYTKQGSELVGGLIISPDDINKHGWIVSDTGFDGNIDPLAGITGRSWLVKHKADIEHGYRQAVATGKVRLFYGLSADGESRHRSANGCKGFESSCLGTPYSLRVKDALGSYIDVEGAFVSTYGFAAYVMAWERMAADTSVAKVFALADACAHDLGDAGADADTGLGRLDVGCMARRIYAASVVVEEQGKTVKEEEVPVVEQAVTVAVKPPPKVTVAVKPTISMPEERKEPENIPAVTEVAKPVITTPTLVALPVTVVADLNKGFAKLGLTVTVSRKNNAYFIVYHESESSCSKSVRRNPQVFYCLDRDRNLMFTMWDGKWRKRISPESYILLKLKDKGRHVVSYNETYQSSSENSLVNFDTNPFYTGPMGVTPALDWGAGWGPTGSRATVAFWLDADNIPDHGWIVSKTGYCHWTNEVMCIPHRIVYEPLLDHRKKVPEEVSEDLAEKLGKMRANYQKALATGKVRLFYGFARDHTTRWSEYLDCQDFEEYCIGLPSDGINPYQVPVYGFELYLMAWERMPAQTHISAIFKIGDDCTEDLGKPGPDAETGLGRLNIGCVINEVYKVNLNPAAATLSVAARKPSSSNDMQESMVLSVSDEGGSQLRAQSSSSVPDDDPARQQFFDDFAQELFSDLGSLRLPGGTEASVDAGFPGDSFRGRYRPAKDVQSHYRSYLPQPGYALVVGKFGVMAISDGEVGIFAKIEGIDVSFSYQRGEDFFGGVGSGQFAFDKVGNTRLMFQQQLLPTDSEHSLLAAGWVRQARVVGGQGALLDSLHGSEYGASLRYDWQHADGISVSATGWTSRFSGGEVGLAGERFAIGSSDWQWGGGVRSSYDF